MDLSLIEPIYDSPAGRRAALERFVRRVDAGETIAPELLRFVADAIRDRIDVVAPQARHRQPRARGDKFLAWFAVECDPDFAALPRTRDGRFAAVGRLLHRDPTSVQRDAASFAGARRGTDSLLIHEHGERYAMAKGLAWPEALRTLASWYEARPVRVRRKSG